MSTQPPLRADRDYDKPVLIAVIAMLGVTDLDDAVATLTDTCDDCRAPAGQLCVPGCNCLTCHAQSVPTKPL